MGVSVETPAYLYRMDHLRRTPAQIRFISFEPLLAALGKLDLDGIHWAIVGGESGPKARPMNREWVTEIRDQCLAARVPFLGMGRAVRRSLPNALYQTFCVVMGQRANGARIAYRREIEL